MSAEAVVRAGGSDASEAHRETHTSGDAGPRILIIKLADLGDALLATPAIARLRRNLPGARLEVLTTATGAPAFERSGLVDKVMIFDKHRYDRPGALLAGPSEALALGRALRSREADAVLLFHPMTTRFGAIKHAGLSLSTGARIRAGLERRGPGAWRSFAFNTRAEDLGFEGSHVVEANERVADAALLALGCTEIRVEAADRHPRFLPDPSDALEAEALLQGLARELDEVRPEGRWIAIHPGSGGFSEARRWPATHYSQVVDALHAKGHRCLIVGRTTDGGADVMAGCRRRPLDLIDRTPLPLLAAILARVDALVANDGGVMHLAAAMDTKVVAIFGPSNDGYWGPWWPGTDRAGKPGPSPHRVVSLDLACRPCFYRGRALGSPDGCAQRDCLTWLQPETVLASLDEVLYL